MLDAQLVASAVKHAVLTIKTIQMLLITVHLGQPAMQLAKPAHPLLLTMPAVLIKIASKV